MRPLGYNGRKREKLKSPKYTSEWYRKGAPRKVNGRRSLKKRGRQQDKKVCNQLQRRPVKK